MTWLRELLAGLVRGLVEGLKSKPRTASGPPRNVTNLRDKIAADKRELERLLGTKHIDR